MSAPRSAPLVAVLAVTHNAAEDLPGWFDAVRALDHRPLEIVVVDCASTDGSAEAARKEAARVDLPARVIALGENRGFAGGMNEALRQTKAPFVLLLNADARPDPSYASVLLGRLLELPRVGAATGRLVRWTTGPEAPLLDACGMRLTKSWRHLDRGSGEPDRGQLSATEWVFGATGAASLFRREALDDVAVDGEIFDPRFHSFREDAELSFRLAERGWKVLYEPTARALHRRCALPERRSALPAFVNYHSLKNRYLLRAYHQTWADFFLTLPLTAARDAGALLWVLLRERSSLAAYSWLWRHRGEIRRRRSAIQARRTRPCREVARWFSVSGVPL